jgi:hypothetical protein
MRSYMNKLGFNPTLRGVLSEIAANTALPPILGDWYYVDPENGSSAAGGKTPESALSNLKEAYDLCTSGDGDGIVLFSSGTTTANTTSYLTQELDWTKHGITVVGVAAPTRMFGRARVSNKQITTGSLTTLSFTNSGTADYISDSASGFLTAGFEVGQMIDVVANSGTNDGQYTISAVTAGKMTLSASDSLSTESAATAGATTITSYNLNLINVSGDNNAFYNVHFGNFSSNENALGCVEISGSRNYFGNCHMIGAGHATPGAVATAYDLKLNGAEEATFEACTFGTDSVLKAAANGEVLIDGTTLRVQFIDCTFLSYSATSGKGAVKSADATSHQGVIEFNGCRFINWNENGIAAVDDVFIGTEPTSGAYLVTPDSMCVGFSGWGDSVYVAGAAAAASAGGQIAVTE